MFLFDNPPATPASGLRAEWATNIRPALYVNSVGTIQRAAALPFGAVTDPIRTASRIVAARDLTRETIRETCNLGFIHIFQSGFQEP